MGPVPTGKKIKDGTRTILDRVSHFCIHVYRLLFAWWKLRHYCRCPGPSKDDRRARREAKWHKCQLDEIEKEIEKYERKLGEINTLRTPWAWME